MDPTHDSPPSGEKRLVFALWLIPVLLWGIIKLVYPHTMATLLIPAGAATIMIIARLKKPPLLKARWGFRLALLFFLTLLSLIVIFMAWHYWRMEELQPVMPSKVYARETVNKIMTNLNRSCSTPSVLYRWRETGIMDTPPEFSQAALFWFTYNSIEKSYTFYQPVPELTTMPAPDGWESQLTAALGDTLVKKKQGVINKRLREGGDYRLTGMLYENEPRLVGMVNDLKVLRSREIPRAFERAYRDFPLLEASIDSRSNGTSLLCILVRDEQDSVIAELGSPGAFLQQKKDERDVYRWRLPHPSAGFTMELILTNNLGDNLRRVLERSFVIFIILWVWTLLAWVRAELHLARMRKED
jgi:hypothetical protein